MAVDDKFLQIKGYEEFLAKLRELPNVLKRKYLRPSLVAGAKVVQAAAVESTPRLKAPVYRQGKMIRKPGLLKERIKVRTSKEATRAGNVGVFVNVKPAAEGQRGKYSPFDPFFWRFVSFKTKKNNGQAPGYVPFLQVGARKLEGEAFDAVVKDLGPRIQKLNDGGTL